MPAGRRTLLAAPLSGGGYATAGLLLSLVKLGVDQLVARAAFGRAWAFGDYFRWPGARLLSLFDLPARERPFALTMEAVALPFIAAGIVLTLRRLRTLGWPVVLVLLFFVPGVNLLFFALLCVAPARPATATEPEDPVLIEALARAGFRSRRAGKDWDPVVAVFGGAAATIALVWLGIALLRDYGYGLFVGVPFFQGLLTTVLACRGRLRSRAECFGLSLLGLFITAVGLLLMAREGAGCLLMSVPIAAPLTFLGSWVGRVLHGPERRSGRARALGLLLMALAPATMAMESAVAPQPRLRSVVTSVLVAAPPERVWQHVLSFPPLPEPDEWIFAAGIACPLRAEIVGEGVGAVRHCVFTTGTFVEPITIWEQVSLLRFDVTEQPPPMREWSPYDIHPPHLDGFLVSRQGQFRLERLPDGRTLLEGTTWYTNRMWPQRYWALWSDALIGAIHRRVLDHVRRLAEGTE